MLCAQSGTEARGEAAVEDSPREEGFNAKRVSAHTPAARAVVTTISSMRWRAFGFITRSQDHVRPRTNGKLNNALPDGRATAPKGLLFRAGLLLRVGLLFRSGYCFEPGSQKSRG
jgi:hypothetical protein